MLSADADVFVPWVCDGTFVQESPCSTTVPSLSTSDLNSPYWDYQDTSLWTEHSVDAKFCEWTSCEEHSLEHIGFDSNLVDQVAVAAMMSMWSADSNSPECPELQNPVPHGTSPFCEVPIASSGQQARLLAPRPEGVWDGPLLIQTSGKIDGCSRLAPTPSTDEIVPEAVWSCLPGFGFDDYVQRVAVPQGLLQDDCCCPEDVALPMQSGRSRAAIGEPAVGSAVVGSVAGRSHSHSAVVKPESLPSDTGSLGFFDGFFFSEVADTDKHELSIEGASSELPCKPDADGRTYTAI